MPGGCTDVGFPMPAALAFLAFGADDLDGHNAVAVRFDFELRDVAQLAEIFEVRLRVHQERIGAVQDDVGFEGFADGLCLSRFF